MKAGMRITFTYAGSALRGTVIQIKDSEATIKLDSGYNLLVPVSELEHVEEHAAKEASARKGALVQDPTLPAVTILHTGGTIASKVDYATGAVIARFEPEELIALFPETLALANVTSGLLRNMWSDDMRFAHYNIIAHGIADAIDKGAEGVIITQGTDTLHYTAAALSFALENIHIPVVIVGSQRSSDRGSSDASANLLGALRFITQTRMPGVFVAMHESADDDHIAIISGLHARKNHSSRRDAFVSINAPLVARVQAEAVEVLHATAAPQGTFSVRPFTEDLKVGLWKAHPQSFAQELLVYEEFDGLVIEGTGLGHAPISEIDEYTREHTALFTQLRRLAAQIPVAMATQTIFGRVNLNVYSPGRMLQEAGVLGNGCDMHPETAFIKLAWLLSNYSKDETRELYGKNIRGELTERLPLEAQHKEKKKE